MITALYKQLHTAINNEISVGWGDISTRRICCYSPWGDKVGFHCEGGWRRSLSLWTGQSGFLICSTSTFHWPVYTKKSTKSLKNNINFLFTFRPLDPYNSCTCHYYSASSHMQEFEAFKTKFLIWTKKYIHQISINLICKGKIISEMGPMVGLWCLWTSNLLAVWGKFKMAYHCADNDDYNLCVHWLPGEPMKSL